MTNQNKLTFFIITLNYFTGCIAPSMVDFIKENLYIVHGGGYGEAWRIADYNSLSCAKHAALRLFHELMELHAVESECPDIMRLIIIFEDTVLARVITNNVVSNTLEFQHVFPFFTLPSPDWYSRGMEQINMIGFDILEHFERCFEDNFLLEDDNFKIQYYGLFYKFEHTWIDCEVPLQYLHLDLDKSIGHTFPPFHLNGHSESSSDDSPGNDDDSHSSTAARLASYARIQENNEEIPSSSSTTPRTLSTGNQTNAEEIPSSTLTTARVVSPAGVSTNEEILHDAREVIIPSEEDNLDINPSNNPESSATPNANNETILESSNIISDTNNENIPESATVSNSVTESEIPRTSS